MTGSLNAITRDEAQEKTRSLGGKISGSISKKTDYLVVGEEPGFKLEKAKKIGTKLLSEQEFLKMVE